jgi:hypothetical protein
MKIRSSILWLVIIAAVLTMLLVWFAKRPTETPSPTVAETNAVVQTAMEQAAAKVEHEAVTRTNALTAQPASSPARPMKAKAEQMKEGLAALNDVPIVFYGKLEDQFGNPVVGAKIAGNTIIYNGVRSGAEHVSATSDANGVFQINAGKGESLGIVPRKGGYALATKDTYFKYSYMYPDHFTPDPNNPTVIKMWKLQREEPLVGIDKEYRFPFTNAPVYFDLAAGKIVSAAGDLQAIITRAPGSISQRNRGDWSIELIPVNGGIMEPQYNTSYITFEAPESGYQSNYLVLMNHDDPAWQDGINKELFLKSKGGQVYSKFSLGFRINNDQDGLMWFRFRGVANTNGSRNWEATAPQ